MDWRTPSRNHQRLGQNKAGANRRLNVGTERDEVDKVESRKNQRIECEKKMSHELGKARNLRARRGSPMDYNMMMETKKQQQ